jgi:gluconokinase
MAAGIALDDADRAPWLDAVGTDLRERRPCIMACSALRRSYRDRLREHAPQTVFALLQLPRAELERRISARADHFMPPELLDSQLVALEHPGTDEEVVVLDATRSVDELAAAVAALLAPRVD